MPRRAVDIPITAQDRTRAAFESAQRRIDGLVGSGGRLAGLFRGGGAIGAGLATIGVAAAGLAVQLKRTIDDLDEIDKAARAAGVDTDTLQSWRLFGELSGATANQVDTSLRRIRRRIGEALDGGEVASQFDRLGVSLVNSTGAVRPLNDVMADLVESLASSGNASQVFAQAVRIGDIEFARFAQGIIDNGGNVREFFASLEASGTIIEKEVIDNAVRAKDAFTEFAATLSGQLTNALGGAIELAADLGDALANAANPDRAAAQADPLADANERLQEQIALLNRISGLSRQQAARRGVNVEATVAEVRLQGELVALYSSEAAIEQGIAETKAAIAATDATVVNNAQKRGRAATRLSKDEREAVAAYNALLERRITLEQAAAALAAGAGAGRHERRRSHPRSGQCAHRRGGSEQGPQRDRDRRHQPACAGGRGDRRTDQEARPADSVSGDGDRDQRQDCAYGRGAHRGGAQAHRRRPRARTSGCNAGYSNSSWSRARSRRRSSTRRRAMRGWRRRRPCCSWRRIQLAAEERSRQVALAKLEILEAEILAKADVGELTRAEADEALAAIQRERDRVNGIEQENVLLARQGDLVRDIGGVIDGFEDSTAGWLRGVSQVLAIFERIAALRGAGAAGDATGAGAGPAGTSGGRQLGGPVLRGRSYVVGERGPEIFTPGMSGGISPTGAGASSTTFVVNLQGIDYGADFATQVEAQTPYIAAKLREVAEQ